MDKRKIDKNLRTPIDESQNTSSQIDARINAACKCFQIDPKRPDRNVQLLIALLNETFPEAFKRIKQKQPNYLKIKKPELFRSVVAAIQADTIDKLDPDGQRYAKEAISWLNYRNMRINKSTITKAFSKCAKTPWQGEKEATLRDCLYTNNPKRPRSNKELLRALERSRKEIFQKHPDDAGIEEQ